MAPVAEPIRGRVPIEAVTPYYDQDGIVIYRGDALSVLRDLPSDSVHCCVTSPPYWGLRDYHCDGQVGLEETPEAYVAKQLEVFREVKRVLRDDGVLWLNLGDSYISGGRGGGGSFADERPGWNNIPQQFGEKRSVAANSGLKRKDLCGIPWRVAFALQADGWWLRQDIIWHKPSPMPEVVTDRCTKAHEYVFLLAKSERYYFDAGAIAEPSVDPESHNGRRDSGYSSGFLKSGRDMARTRDGFAKIPPGKTYPTRNKRSVWTVATKPYPSAHYATFPPDLIKPMISAGCPEGGTVLDPFVGSGTTAQVALELGCRCIGIELNAEYIERDVKNRLAQSVLPFGG